jgi:hypothetical protein
MKFLLFSLLVHSLTFLHWISSFNLAMSMARVLNFVAGLNVWGGDQPLCFDHLSGWSLISIFVMQENMIWLTRFPRPEAVVQDLPLMVNVVPYIGFSCKILFFSKDAISIK